jgi:hypothetical protein
VVEVEAAAVPGHSRTVFASFESGLGGSHRPLEVGAAA